MTDREQTAATPATVSFPTDREVRIERVFDAPRERVFATMLDPGLIPEWWGPHGVTTVVDRMDARTGGSWRFVISHPDGRENGFRGEYREIVAPELIVMTFEWEGMPGNVTVETSRFDDLGTSTKLTVISAYPSAEAREAASSPGMERGMNETYARLDAVLARAGAG